MLLRKIIDESARVKLNEMSKAYNCKIKTLIFNTMPEFLTEYNKYNKSHTLVSKEYLRNLRYKIKSTFYRTYLNEDLNEVVILGYRLPTPDCIHLREYENPNFVPLVKGEDLTIKEVSND